MTSYELMIKTNYSLIKGEELSDKQSIVTQLLDARSTTQQANRFYSGVGFPNNTDNMGRRMYPIFFIPPYNNGKKYRTVTSQMPGTYILSANSYELEIIRLLYILAPENVDVMDMVSQILARLKTTCFGNEDDGVGECFDTSLIVLRFLAVTAPDETVWIKERIANYYKYINAKHRVWSVKWYFWLCLCELPFEIAEPEILKYRNEIIKQLNRSYVMNNHSDSDRDIHRVLVCLVRNVMARLLEYEYIKDRQPYMNKKDGRLYFDMSVNLI